MLRKWSTRSTQIVLVALVAAIPASTTALRVPPDAVNTMTSIAASYVGLIITIQSIFFAFVIGDTGVWPGVLRVAKNSAFLPWLLTIVLSTILAIFTLFWHNAPLETATFVACTVCMLIGTYSFIRVFQYSTIQGRQPLLKKYLSSAFERLARNDGWRSLSKHQAFNTDDILESHLFAMESAIQNNDRLLVSNLCRQIVEAPVNGTGALVQLSYRIFLAERTLRGYFQGTTSVSTVTEVVDCLCKPRPGKDPQSIMLSGTISDTDAVALGPDIFASSAIMEFTGWAMTAIEQHREANDNSIDDLIAHIKRIREQHLRYIDPMPPGSGGSLEQHVPQATPVEALFFLSCSLDFGLHPGLEAVYPVFSLLTGYRTKHNYADSWPILQEMTDIIFPTGQENPPTPQMNVSRHEFGTRSDFGSAMTWILANSISTFQDVHQTLDPFLLRIWQWVYGSQADTSSGDSLSRQISQCLACPSRSWFDKFETYTQLLNDMIHSPSKNQLVPSFSALLFIFFLRSKVQTHLNPERHVLNDSIMVHFPSLSEATPDLVSIADKMGTTVDSLLHIDRTP